MSSDPVIPRLATAAALVVLALAAPAPAPARLPAPQAGVLFFPDDPVEVDPDRRPIDPPQEVEAAEFAEAIEKSLLELPGLDSPEARYAVNVNTLGEVPESSWFTPRHGQRRLSIAELVRGPDTEGPPAEGPWRVTGTTSEGRTPKLFIEDRDGRSWLVKLETPGHPELMSAAEVVCTKFFHSFGYNVPENHVVTFHPDQLVAPEGTYPEHDLKQRLEEMPRTADGRVRAVASLLLPGEPLGPFRYQGTRPDDPNDVFDHQHRRELRALRVFAAWLNHTDVKAANSLDTYVEAGPDGRGGHVRHHLIDFGSCLGSAANGAKDPLTGNEHYLEVGRLLKGIAGLGLWARPFVTVDYPDYPAVGTLEADLFDPATWRPPIPNPAFRLMDAADAFWAARIVARYTDEEVRAIVETGAITDPEAEDYLVEVLQRRRDKVVSTWLTWTNPLDRFTVEGRGGALRLRFRNLAVAHDVASPAVAYRTRWFRLDNHDGDRQRVDEGTGTTEGDGPDAVVSVPDSAWGPEDAFGQRFALVEISTVHADHPHWERPVTVVLRRHGSTFEVVGVRRPRQPSTTNR